MKNTKSLSTPFECLHNPWVKSLNAACLVDLPGINLEDNFKNKTGSELLSLSRLLDDFTVDIDKSISQHDFISYVNDALVHIDHDHYKIAQNLAINYGKKLGIFFLMLCRGDNINIKARPKDFFWSSEQWQFWSAIKSIALSGGIIEGDFGRIVIAHTNQLLKNHGQVMHLHHYPYPKYISLIGLARISNKLKKPMLMFDFGKTNIKIGCAYYKNNQVSKIIVYPSQPSMCKNIKKNNVSRDELQIFSQWMVEVIEKNYTLAKQANNNLSGIIALSLGGYVIHGNPTSIYGDCYGKLRKIIPNVPYWLNKELKKINPSICHVYINNDADCAGYALNEHEFDAVLTLGTGLGFGVARANEHSFIDLADSFELLIK